MSLDGAGENQSRGFSILLYLEPISQPFMAGSWRLTACQGLSGTFSGKKETRSRL